MLFSKTFISTRPIESNLTVH